MCKLTHVSAYSDVPDLGCLPQEISRHCQSFFPVENPFVSLLERRGFAEILHSTDENIFLKNNFCKSYVELLRCIHGYDRIVFTDYNKLLFVSERDGTETEVFLNRM